MKDQRKEEIIKIRHNKGDGWNIEKVQDGRNRAIEKLNKGYM